MSPTCADTPHLIMKAQEVNDVVPKLEGQKRAREDLRGQTAVSALKLGAHRGHAADHSGELLPQRIDEAITPVAAGTTQAKTLAIEFDVKPEAAVPIRSHPSCCLLETVSQDADVHLADVRHCVSLPAVGVIQGPVKLTSGSPVKQTPRILMARVSDLVAACTTKRRHAVKETEVKC